MHPSRAFYPRLSRPFSRQAERGAASERRGEAPDASERATMWSLAASPSEGEGCVRTPSAGPATGPHMTSERRGEAPDASEVRAGASAIIRK